MTRLERLVSQWKEDNKKDLDTELDFYDGNKLDWEEVIDLAARALNVDGRKLDHQYRIPPQTLQRFSKILRADSKRWPDKLIFAELFQKVQEAAPKVGGGIGPLAIYDTALRIAWSKGVKPDEVYLQRGALWGAQALHRKGLLDIPRLGRSVPLGCFPSELRELDPYQLENFLCVNHKELAAL